MSLIAENSMQIDVNNSGINNAVAVQGDHIGRKIKITLLSQGEVVDLTNCTATVKCSANGKTIAVNSCDINANVVTVELTKTMLAFVGKIKMQVSVTDSGGAVISTPIIYLIVSESISTTPVEQTPDFSILADLTGRIMAVLNDPAVGDTEVKDARGGYTVLGDRLKAVDNATAEIINTLGKHTHTKNIYTAANWSLYNGITMTPHADGGYVSFNGTANTSSQTFLLSLDESIKLDSNKATFALAKIRLRAVGANVTVSFRDDAFFNSTNVIATNAQTITGTWITDKLTDGEWRTIWVVTGGDKTITKLGIQPLPATSDYELQVSSVDCYYSGDGAEVADIITRLAAAEGNISSLQNSVKANADNITSLQTTTSENTANISDLQATVNGSASTSGTVKNQIATAKTEVVEESVNPLAERVKATENHVSTLQTEVSTLNTYSTQIGEITDVTGGLIAGFVNANTGILGTGGNYQRTDYIPVSSNAVVYYSGRIMGWAGVAGFDKNKKYVAAILKNDDNVAKSYDKHLLNIPDNVKYIIATTLAKSFGLEIITHKKIVDFKIEPDSNIIPNLNHFAVFKSFSAIGDSITEGLYPSTFNEDGSVKKWATNKSFSWVRYLGALTGASNYNYGVSGATAKTWYTNQYGYSMMVNNNKRTQAYIIGLGVNDTISADYPIGSIADVDFNDCLNNAETFIGCYAKIIQSVISLNPTAKIFCLIPPNISASTASKYDALKTLIADEHFVGTVFCVDLSSQDYKGFYQTDAVTKFKFGVHYSAPGYAQLAKILLYALSKTMIDNSQYFNQISEIVYDN